LQILSEDWVVLEIGNNDGTSDSNFELRVFDPDGQHVATFKQSTLRSASVSEDTQGIPYCEVRVVSDERAGAGLIDVGSIVEVWASRGAEPLAMLIRAFVDFLDCRIGNRAEEGDAVIELQARSCVSVCMDSPYHVSGFGSLSDLVSAILNPFQIRTNIESEANNLSYCVNVESAYAALRLLGITFNSVVSTTRENEVVFTTAEKALDRLSKQPVKAISEAEIEGARMQKGQPIRRRR
jgi:hypothetical protein